MSWAKFAIETLQTGETAQGRPRGHSMTGKVNHRDLVTRKPSNPDNLDVDAIVRAHLHLIKAKSNDRFLVGSSRGGLNGRVGANAIYGIATEITA